MVAPNPVSITNIKIPQSEFLDPLTKRPAREWLFWLQNPNFVNISLQIAVPISSGGTGLTTLPSNGQLLIGNNGAYSLNTLTSGQGIGVVNGSGSITIENTGVLSIIAGPGIEVNQSTGNVTVSSKSDQENQTATSGQTVFTLTTMTYTPGTNSLSVFVDGVNQLLNDAFTETNSTTVTFTEGLHVGAKVRFATA